MRSYQHQSTGSHQNSEVKRAWARVVLGWVTSWEVLVLHSLLKFFCAACKTKRTCAAYIYHVLLFSTFALSFSPLLIIHAFSGGVVARQARSGRGRNRGK